MKRLGLVLVMFQTALTCCVHAGVYYVAPNGSDSNPGTLQRPFSSINKGAALLDPGDTLYLRAGTYHQTVYVGGSGTAGLPITIAGYPGEEAIIDGEHTLPSSSWSVLFIAEGNRLVVRDLTIKRSNWIGLQIKGHHSQAINVKSHLHMENGILVNGSASYSIVEGCEVFSNCMSNEQFQRSRGDWASGLSAARGPEHVALRNNRVWNNWGEGLSTYETQYTLIEGNTVYDNQLNIYISDTRHATVRNNLIYSTPGNPCYRESQVGIALGDERYNPPSSDNLIVNNLLLGNAKNLYYWSGVSGGGLVNVTIAHNTFVNGTSETNLKLLAGHHTNTWIGNNIVVQEDSLPVLTLGTTVGLTFSHNLWSKSRPSIAAGQDDVIADPRLLKNGTTGPGQLDSSYFQISSTSPAKNAATKISAVPEDFSGVSRGESPDIGAFQATFRPPENLRVQTE